MGKKVFVVTGGGSGMGLAIAKEFVKRGAVVICGRTVSKLDNALAQLKEMGEAYSYACDMSDYSQVEGLAKFASEIGEVTCLVNCAGVSASMSDGEKVIRINLYSVVNGMKAFKEVMAKGSSIINIGSCTAYMYPMAPEARALFAKIDEKDISSELVKYTGGNNDLAYGYAKVALVAYSKEKTLEFAAKGIRVNSVSPGAVETDVMKAELENEATKQFIASIPVGRVGQPEDIGYICDFLASDKAGYITGIDVVVDGGSLALIAAMAQ